jgi:signal transduction histidine kinase/CheY-like chemotaxis protein
VVGVALLAWSQSEHRLTRPTRTYAIETALVALGAIVLLLCLLGGAASTTHPLLVQMFFMFPFVIWSGLRLGLRTTSTLIVVFTCVSVVVAATHGDVLRMGEERESLEVLQLFIGVLAVMGLVIATVTREHRRTHAEMSTTLSLLEATLDSTADGILVVDSGGVQTRANRRFVELWGIPGEILETRDDARILEFVLDQLADPAGFLARVEALYSHPEDQSFDEVQFKDGRILERYSMPQREHGLVVGRVWSFRDVTRQRRLEHDLRQTHKMEAVGRLAGGVAHDFNNLLTVVIGHCGLLLGSVKGSPAARAEVEAITIAARRAAELTRQLLAFSRRQVLTPQRLDLNQVMHETAVMLAGVLGGDIALRLQPSPGLGAVNVDPGQIQQVLLNLVLNARDAMPQGGVIVLGTGEVTRAEGALDSLALAPGRYVVLTVSDTGLGMDDLTRAHLFEPFYTTKGFGRGTGLGLATVYGIVRQSGGDIAVVSAPGRGTEFRILLPRMEAPAPAAPSLMSESLPRGNGTLLLVEDDASVRDFMVEALRRAGYDVRVAGEGGEALRVAEGLEGTLDVLVTDIVMPGMGGAELAVRMRERHPEIPVLFVSGYADELHQGGIDGVRGGRYLQKPFTPEVLVRMVGETLGSRAKAA